MSRPRLALTLTMAGSTALAVLACSGAASSPSAAIPSVALPSVAIPTVSIPPLPTISIPPIPSGLPSDLPSFSLPPIPSGLPSGIPSFAIPTFHQAPDLENALPNQIRGVTLQKSSFTGELFLGGSGNKTFQAVLAQFNKQPSDLQFAGANDPTRSLAFQLAAFRLAGVDANQFVSAIITAGQASGSVQPTISTGNAGGKPVTIFTDANGTKSYFYPKGEVAYLVSGTTDDALLADILAALP